MQAMMAVQNPHAASWMPSCTPPDPSDDTPLPNRVQEVRDAVRLLRLPFSVFLMPVFWFAASQLPVWDGWRLLQVFLILHLLLYPSSNAYNSFHDRDEGSIGGLAKPPPVNAMVLYSAWALEVAAIAWAYLLEPAFALLIAGYSLVSRAYSHRRIRLKRYPVLSFLVVVTFQGWYTYLAVWTGSSDVPISLEGVHFPGLVSSLFLAGYYPLTQIYQHEEDGRRGDRTLSLVLGYRGTFAVSATAFLLGFAGLSLYLVRQAVPEAIVLFLLFLFPAAIYFLKWSLRVREDEGQADFASTMTMTKLSTLGLSAFFITLILLGWPS